MGERMHGIKQVLADRATEWLFKAGLLHLKDPQATGFDIGYRKGVRARARFEKKIAWANVPDDVSELTD